MSKNEILEENGRHPGSSSAGLVSCDGVSTNDAISQIVESKFPPRNFLNKICSLDLPKRDSLTSEYAAAGVLLQPVNRASNHDEEVSLLMTRPQSLPGMLPAVRCHCSACCSCSPHQLNCFIPSFSFSRTTTSASLDAGIDDACFSRVDGPPTLHPTADPLVDEIAVPAKDDHVARTQHPIANCLPKRLQAVQRSSPAELLTHVMPVTSEVATNTYPELFSQRCQCQSLNAKFNDDERELVAKQEISRKKFVNQSSIYAGVQPLEFKQRIQEIKNWFTEFNDDQKNLVFKALLEESRQSQMHFLSSLMEGRLHSGCQPNCQDPFSWLPEIVSFTILSYLDPINLCRASSVNRRWNELANDPSLWRHLSVVVKWRMSKASEPKQTLTFKATDDNNYIDWKGLFADRFRLQNNWIKGRCNIRTFEGHTQGVSCVQFDETRIVSGSSDKTIKLWNIRTNSPWAVQTLVGHSGTVRCLHLDGNRLVSGSTDRTIKVWDLSSQQSWASIACKVTMVGHVDTVRCLKVDADKVISGSYDKTLKVWDIKTGACRRTLRGHEAAVLCMQFDDLKIVSGSCDKTIKVWTFDGDCIMTLQGHQDAVTCLQFDETRIISGSLDCTLRFWDVHKGQLIKTIDWKASEGHTRVIRCLQADSWRVVSASDDKTIKVWNLETGQRLATLRNHTDGVTCLQFNDKMLVSGSYDKTVKLWNFNCC